MLYHLTLTTEHLKPVDILHFCSSHCLPAPCISIAMCVQDKEVDGFCLEPQPDRQD